MKRWSSSNRKSSGSNGRPAGQRSSGTNCATFPMRSARTEAGVIGTGCEAVQGNSVIVEPGGTILGCSHWVEHPLLNIYKNYEALELLEPEEFWEQWATGRPKEFRDELRYFPYEECEDCGWRKDRKCFGGCKVWQSAGALPKLRAFDDLNNSLPDNNPILGRLALPVLTELK